MMANSTIGITFIIYIIGMLALGLVAYRRTSNLSDYLLGGRSLGPWTSALSAGASDMSGWLLLGLPGAIFASGLSAIWIGVGLLAGTWLNWLIVERRMRIYSFQAKDALTLPEFFSQRFHDKGHLLRVVSAMLILTFFLFYTSAGLVAGGKLFETVFAFDYKVAVTIGTLAVISYTFFGGFLAVSWTDLVQGLMMAAALLVVPIVAYNQMDGIMPVLQENPNMLKLFTDAGTGQSLTIVGIISLLAWGLGYFGQPHILARFAAIRSEDDIPTARRIAVIWTALGLIGACMVGFLGLGFIDGQLIDGEMIFVHMVNAIFHPVMAGILLAAILAAVMSTADSQLLVSSSALADDFYKALIRPNASQQELVWVGRAAVMIIAVIAWLLALNPESSVLGLVSYAWAGFGAAFGPAVILSLYWKRMNKHGALAGIIVGALTVLFWKEFSHYGPMFEIYELVPGFILSAAAIVTVSLLSEVPSGAIKIQFEEATI
jgi:sodium/proline symporter